MRRFDMRLPALVKFGAEQEPQFSTETQNVSARGVFFHLDHKLEKGAKIEVTMTFPQHVTNTDSVRVRFSAQVLRVEALPYDRIGVAAVIDKEASARGSPRRTAGDIQMACGRQRNDCRHCCCSTYARA